MGLTFTIPTVAEIGTRIRTAFRVYLPGTDAMIEPNNLSVTGKSFALALFDIYQRIAYLYRQLFASTADGQHLEFRHAAEYGLTRKPAAPATGNVLIPQVTAEAQTIPSGITLMRDDGVAYLTTAAATALDGVFTVAVQCTTTGSTTDAPPGSTLTVVQQGSVPNLNGTASVSPGGLGGGADTETDPALRARVLQRKQFTPMCGTVSDYQRWATAVPGCTRAYASPFSNQPPGVVVYPLFDTTRDQGIPLQSDLDAVSAGVEPLRPVTARVFYVAATPNQIDVVISELDANTEANQTAIQTQLAALFAAVGAVSTVTDPLTIRVGWINAAIDRALNGGGFTLESPAADVAVPIGSLAFLGQVSFPTS